MVYFLRKSFRSDILINATSYTVCSLCIDSNVSKNKFDILCFILFLNFTYESSIKNEILSKNYYC